MLLRRRLDLKVVLSAPLEGYVRGVMAGMMPRTTLPGGPLPVCMRAIWDLMHRFSKVDLRNFFLYLAKHGSLHTFSGH